MGKNKNKKFKRPQFSVDGLPLTVVKENEDECVDSPAGEMLEKISIQNGQLEFHNPVLGDPQTVHTFALSQIPAQLYQLQSPSADVREYACASISRMVQQRQVIPAFLQRDAVRCLGPLLLDRSLAVRETSAGALRNLSACGGFEVCDDMVKQDVLTPLMALLRECHAGFDSAAPAEPRKELRHSVEDVANEAVHLLWNLCESSSRAVSVFNKSGLLDVLLRCLAQHPHNVELALSAAHCLQTVTEENSDLLDAVNFSVLQGLESVLLSPQMDMAHVLLRTLVAGTTWNLKSSMPSDRQAHMLGAIVETLDRALELDSGRLIPELWEADEARCRAAAEGGADGNDGDGTEDMEEEENEEAEGDCKARKGRRNCKRDDNFSDLQPPKEVELREANALLVAQQTSLEIIVNMCCSDDPSDDEWEETSSSDESEICPDGISDGNSNLLSPLCLSAEVHSALVNFRIPEKVLRKTEFPSSTAMEVCRTTPAWKGLMKKMQRVQCRALTCLHNILSVMEVEVLGGATALQALAEHLSKLVFSTPEIPMQEEFLEAVISALRSLLQMMASKKIPQCITPQQLMSLSEAASRCDAVSVRVNAMAILGITGSVLAREADSADNLQLIGNALLQVASKDPNMVVCGEALDALFDVFADGKEAERAACSIGLLPALTTLQPVFKAKLRKEGKGKYSAEQLCVLDNIKVNLRRFIGYLGTLEKSSTA